MCPILSFPTPKPPFSLTSALAVSPASASYLTVCACKLSSGDRPWPRGAVSPAEEESGQGLSGGHCRRPAGRGMKAQPPCLEAGPTLTWNFFSRAPIRIGLLLGLCPVPGLPSPTSLQVSLGSTYFIIDTKPLIFEPGSWRGGGRGGQPSRRFPGL